MRHKAELCSKPSCVPSRAELFKRCRITSKSGEHSRHARRAPRLLWKTILLSACKKQSPRTPGHSDLQLEGLMRIFHTCMLITSAIHLVQLFLHICNSTNSWVWFTCSHSMQNTTSSHPQTLLWPKRADPTAAGWAGACCSSRAVPALPLPTQGRPDQLWGRVASIWAEDSVPGQIAPCQRRSCSTLPLPR